MVCCCSCCLCLGLSALGHAHFARLVLLVASRSLAAIHTHFGGNVHVIDGARVVVDGT